MLRVRISAGGINFNNGEVMIMKKFLAAFLSVMIVMCASVTAFGATKSDVNKVVNTSVAYAFDGKYSQGGYTTANAKNFYILAKSGADVSAYKEAFFASAKDAAAAGTLTDVGTLGEIITIADKLGMNPENIDGVNYVEMLKNADPANCGVSPYNYLFAAEAASAHGLADTADAFCDKMIGYYTIGTGTDFWGGYGTSADDLAMFLITLKYGSNDYSQYTNDAFALLENTYSADGYVNYTPSADSTALALAAYSAYGNKTKADDVYKLLIDKFYDGTTGGFKADYDPYYATADAVFALAYYLPIADSDPAPQQPQETTTKAETTTAQATQAKKDTGKKSPATGSTGIAAASFTAAGAAIVLALSAKKKHEA